MRLSQYVVGAALLISLPAAGAHGDVIIDFESFPGPDGLLGTGDDVPINAPTLFSEQSTQLTTQFAAVGIEFLPERPLNDWNEILDDSSFRGTAGSPDHLLSTNRNQFDFGPVEARFTVPVRAISMAIGLGNQLNLLEIFDSSNTLIDSVTGLNTVVSLTSTLPIARFKVTAVELGEQAAIDDIRFSAVPEPGACVLMGLGSVALLRRRE